MNAKTKKIIFIVSIVVAISILIINLCTKPVKNVDNSIIKLTPEQQRTMTYNVVEKNSTIVDNTDNNMQFSAFFTKDNQQLDGTCNKLNIKPELFINLNIQSKGSLQDGKIIIEGKNFNYSMFMIKDDVLSESYISDDVTEITLNEVKAGTNKMIFGNVIADIQNNTNNYGGESTVTLTGTYVKEDGTKVQIEKKCNITVDWYGDIKASLSTSKHTYHYDNMSSNKITFGFYVNETAKDLLLDEVLATVEIPQLNGQDPVSVECSDSSVEDTYDTNTRKLTLKCKSTIDDQGVVTKSLSRQRYFNIIVTYPPEAIAAIQEYTQLEVPITGKFIGYNNPNEEFKDEKESNLAEGKIVLEFTKTPEIDPVKPTKYSHGFGIEILKKVYVSKPSNRYILSI